MLAGALVSFFSFSLWTNNSAGQEFLFWHELELISRNHPLLFFVSQAGISEHAVMFPIDSIKVRCLHL